MKFVFSESDEICQKNMLEILFELKQSQVFGKATTNLLEMFRVNHPIIYSQSMIPKIDELSVFSKGAREGPEKEHGHEENKNTMNVVQ